MDAPACGTYCLQPSRIVFGRVPEQPDPIAADAAAPGDPVERPLDKIPASFVGLTGRRRVDTHGFRAPTYARPAFVAITGLPCSAIRDGCGRIRLDHSGAQGESLAIRDDEGRRPEARDEAPEVGGLQPWVHSGCLVGRFSFGGNIAGVERQVGFRKGQAPTNAALHDRNRAAPSARSGSGAALEDV